MSVLSATGTNAAAAATTGLAWGWNFFQQSALSLAGAILEVGSVWCPPATCRTESLDFHGWADVRTTPSRKQYYSSATHVSILSARRYQLCLEACSILFSNKMPCTQICVLRFSRTGPHVCVAVMRGVQLEFVEGAGWTDVLRLSQKLDLLSLQSRACGRDCTLIGSFLWH